MFLLIFEDGDAGMIEKLSQGDYDSCDDGMCQIFRVGDDKKSFEEYYNGTWKVVANFGEGDENVEN